MGRLTTYIAVISLGLVASMVANADETYFTATGNEDGKLLIFRSITAVPHGIEKAQFPNRVNIIWHFDPSNNGMPGAEVNEKQIEFEDAIQPLNVNDLGRQMLVVTGNGRKEWYWYVRDLSACRSELGQRIADHTYPITITSAYDPDWSLCEDFIAGVKGL
ncbi:DUF695 domain-containing protein [Neorhizobium sp. Rsf11]|uniref:DUF695 domain-containing protein n=1 Tax=Neorhizobium phenanthreniclasticum TaxID=3157917 RepID=A0ABV0M0C0_9HYPH